MDKILLEEKEVLEYIKDVLYSYKTSFKNINDKYHHNSDYQDASSICRHGILSIVDLNKLGIRNDSNEIIKTLGDIESHINGNDKVSLSIVGLNDLYRDEFEYNPYKPDLVDFIVSDEIEAIRLSTHYGNEFLSNSINVDKLRSVDIRLLELINKKDSSINNIIKKYNCLKEVALEIKKRKLDISLREMSKDKFNIDIDKISQTPILELKKQ